MSEVKVNKLSPRSGTTVTLGDSGDTITIPSGVTFDASSGGLAGTLTTAAQPNITSVGTLTSFTSTGIDDNANSTAIVIDSNNNVAFLDGTGSLPSITNSGDKNTGIYFAAADTLGFSTGGSERMRIDSLGNVGIGTSSPDDRLHVNSGTQNDVAKFESTDTTASLILVDSSTTTDGNRIQTIGDTMNFQTAGSEAMRITSSGNVGIGTSSPANNLHIFTDASGEGILVKSTGNTYNDIIGDANRSGAGNAIVRLRGNWNGNSVAMIAIHAGDDTTNKDDGRIEFFTSASGGSQNERMRIEPNGNVGIGITNPSFPLDLSGNGLNNSTVSSSTQYGLRANLHLCFSPGSTTLGNMNDQRNIAVRNRYGTGTSNSPGGNGVVMAFQHYPNGTTGNGSSYITQMAFEHNSNPAGNIYFRNSDVSTGATFSNWYSIDLTNTSDIRSKENIIDAPEQITRLKNLNIKQFNYKNNTEGTNDLGLIAQEADEIIPEYVVKNNENPEAMWRILYNRMTPMLIKCIQEQQTKIEELEARITTLETNNP